MAGVPISAKAAKVRINSTVLFNSSWTATPETAYLDTSNMEGGGFEDQIGGLRKLDIHVEGWYDSSTNFYTAPLSLQDGSVVSFICYTNDIGSPNWAGTALIKGTPMKSDVHGLVLYTLDMKAKGAFTTPN